MTPHGFVVCVSNVGYEASLVVRRIYQYRPDPDGQAAGLIRVTDESGEDYLYSAEMFEEIELPTLLKKRLHFPS